MSIFKKILTCLFVFSLFSATVFANHTKDNTQKFIAVSDVHFDPFQTCGNATPCLLIDKLAQANASDWQQILTEHDTRAPQYGQDTNFTLLNATLDGLKKTAQTEQTSFVLLMGDLLAHDYQKRYMNFATNKSPEAYQAFVKKTLEFLTIKFNIAFPDKNVYAVTGNNDTYQDHYYVEPNGAFFNDIASVWGRLIKDADQREVMTREFKTGGYYSVRLNQKLQLISLDTVLFSNKAKGPGVDDAAQAELVWLENELKRTQVMHQKALIIMHIPTGIDVHATINSSPFNIVEHLKPEYTSILQHHLTMFSDSIVGVLASHLHRDGFEILKLGDKELPEVLVPGISPVTGNYAAFKVMQFSDNLLQLSDAVTYVYPLDGAQGWIKEYDFNEVYQSTNLLQGMDNLKPNGDLANYYQKYFLVGTTSEPIVAKWLPYYWCSIGNITASDYQHCMETK